MTELRLALTCDDAPTISARGRHVARDPERMDRLRVTLSEAGVRHCVAFVISGEANDVGVLTRWLAAGFELGNHTHDHVAASAVGVDTFLRSARRCDTTLSEVGAFEHGRAKWFRFPYLDYGADRDQRARIAAALGEQGYRLAHATVDLHDDRFEEALGAAEAHGERLRAGLIGARYRRTARRSLDEARLRLGDAVPQVPYFHFGGVSDRFIGEVVRAWRASARFCTLDEALEHPALQRDDGTGLLLGDSRPGLVSRATRRARLLTNRLDPTRGRWLGPPWPRAR